MTKELELFLYKIPENFMQDEEVYYLHYPKQLKEYVRTKHKEGTFNLKINFNQLNKKLKSMFPSIICFQTREALFKDVP